MDSLTDTVWDVVLAGTGLPQSLLALALSRSGKKVLHIDRNDYYGGAEAAFSLQEVAWWVDSVNDASQPSIYRNAIATSFVSEGDSRLGFSRSYSISLSPHLVYTRSSLLPALVSSKVYRQLEFLAIGSWWIYEDVKNEPKGTEDHPVDTAQIGQGRLFRIPGSREDIFQNQSIDLRSARSLMKFLKVAADANSHPAIIERWGNELFSTFLLSEFNISLQLQAPLFSLTASMNPPSGILTSDALPRIYRHLTSIGLFGQGFNAVVAKWGGLAEIAQVACRAGAVGGGVYVLKKGIERFENSNQTYAHQETLNLVLQGGEKIETRWVAGTRLHLAPEVWDQLSEHQVNEVSRNVTIVSSSLSSLFPVPSEGAPSTAGAIVYFATGSLTVPADSIGKEIPPVFLMIHSSDTGECPAGQCIIYAQILLPNPNGSTILAEAIRKFIAAVPEDPKPDILWSLHYSQTGPLTTDQNGPKIDPLNDPRIMLLHDLNPGLALEDSVLNNVKAVWEQIVGEETGGGFMMFEDRDGVEEDEQEEGLG